MAETDKLLSCAGFDWDEANAHKIWNKHGVSPMECEEAFFNQPLVVGPDAAHSRSEQRHFALGQTETGRRLFLVVTIRGKLLRVISARDMSRKERKVYEES